MPEKNDIHGPLRLKIVSRTGVIADLHCLSVRLCVADNADGKGGGSLGIHKKSLKSVIKLTAGKIIALPDGGQALEYEIPGGFATVEDDTVTVLTD